MNNDSFVDILAFGAHADDVEIGMGGTIAKYTEKGLKIAICDLTKAELSSNGTVELRQKEAKKAAEILSVDKRIQLELNDRHLYIEAEKIKNIVSIIRMYKPKLVFAPYYEDRHPDHAHCATLVKEAIFSAKIKKYADEKQLAPHQVDAFYMYMINGFHKPSFIIDISNYIDTKLAALYAYESQFVKKDDNIETPLTNNYIETIKARESLFGKEVGVAFGEGFISEQPILLQQLLKEK